MAVLSSINQALANIFSKENKKYAINKQSAAQDVQEAFDHLNKYFYGNFGDMWLTKVPDEESQKFWRLHLVGLTLGDVALGIDLWISGDRTDFPPNPAQFRALCLRGKKMNSNKLKNQAQLGWID